MKGFDSIVTFCYTRDIRETHLFYNGLLELPMVLDQGRCRIYHCFVKDPSGYTVEIQRFEDPRWKRG